MINCSNLTLCIMMISTDRNKLKQGNKSWLVPSQCLLRVLHNWITSFYIIVTLAHVTSSEDSKKDDVDSERPKFSLRLASTCFDWSGVKLVITRAVKMAAPSAAYTRLWYACVYLRLVQCELSEAARKYRIYVWARFGRISRNSTNETRRATRDQQVLAESAIERWTISTV